MKVLKVFLAMVLAGIGNCAHAQSDDNSATELAPIAYDVAADMLAADSIQLVLPYVNTFGQVENFSWQPYYWRPNMQWDLHKGLNLNLGLSVFAQLGKHSYGGVGFTQDISALYAVPVTDKLSVAVGGWLSNINWANNSWHDAGLTAIVGYRFDQHWEAFLYGQKSIVRGMRMPYPLYDMQQLGDKIGASVRYNVNPSMSIEVSVERSCPPAPRWGVPQPKN